MKLWSMRTHLRHRWRVGLRLLVMEGRLSELGGDKRMGASRAMRMAAVARRVAGSLPAPVRARVRDVVTWSDRMRPPPIEGWSRPLVGTNPGAEASLKGLIQGSRHSPSPRGRSLRGHRT